MKNTIIVFALSALSGCQAGGGWNKHGATEQEFRTASYECERDSRQANFGQIVNTMFIRCMQSKGWYWQKQ